MKKDIDLEKFVDFLNPLANCYGIYMEEKTSKVFNFQGLNKCNFEINTCQLFSGRGI